MSQKQMEVFNDYHRFLLVTGPRKCGKTWGICHKILRHCFDNNGARVAMFTKTTKNAKAGGVWIDLTQIALPEWINANMGMRVIEEPKVTGDTRMSFFRVSNRWGGMSEVQLHSLEYCPEIVDKIKGGRFSMVYFSELDNFDDRIVFDISEDQLRMPGIPYEQHQWIGDTNPPDTGPNNWLHDLWFKEREQDDHPDPEYQKHIHKIHFKLEDNPFLDPREKATLIAKYRRRKSLYNRFILGEWEEDLTDGFFADVFREDVHVMGSTHQANRSEWEIITPTPACRNLLLGLDPGNVNHSAHIVEKIETPSGEPVFSVLDDVVSTDVKVSIREFTEAVLQRMAFWEEYCKNKYNHKVKWETWSDNSVYRYNSAAEVDEALIMRNLSRGKIMPMAMHKFANSVKARVDCLHRLLWENRIFISAMCRDTISMIKALKKGTNRLDYVARSKHKHPFDSLTYILINEDPMAMEENAPMMDKGAPSRLIIAG